MRELEPEEALKLIDELTSAKCRNCARLTALLEDRQALTKFLMQQIPVLTFHFASDVADRLIAYLKPPLG